MDVQKHRHGSQVAGAWLAFMLLYKSVHVVPAQCQPTATSFSSHFSCTMLPYDRVGTTITMVVEFTPRILQGQSLLPFGTC